MSATRSRRATALAALASIALLLSVAGPVAADEEPAFDVTFDAGQVCAFALRIEGFGDGQKIWEREFPGGRLLSAGTGFAMRYTNVATGATMATRSNGAVTWATVYPDGSRQLTLLGHNVVLLFPSDTTPGPSTILYAGRVVIDVDPSNNYTVQGYTGTATDICAALSS